MNTDVRDDSHGHTDVRGGIFFRGNGDEALM